MNEAKKTYEERALECKKKMDAFSPMKLEYLGQTAAKFASLSLDEKIDVANRAAHRLVYVRPKDIENVMQTIEMIWCKHLYNNTFVEFSDMYPVTSAVVDAPGGIFKIDKFSFNVIKNHPDPKHCLCVKDVTPDNYKDKYNEFFNNLVDINVKDYNLAYAHVENIIKFDRIMSDMELEKDGANELER